nr:cytochrome c oxidase subunit 2 [Pneumocystis jirovecii]AFR90407.1 cytochrome c oxidase subunit 2 [Pneumocystis jirovecii]AFV57347.1 cytochrome c oxidase subunit 2 [Pneumocystis jirovecii]AFV57362.1 cytochrome c oxidase subunit 2 [Pneumocystis jirovecii]AFV57376.1 cytochrome c oxidase subunit 2 [Pneumocystis jirovecii]QVV24882.1 cytochrome c oxidase subunit 2 [Pneumocystis jirovecii]
MSVFCFIFNHPICCDAPSPWGVYFQDGASPVFDGIVELHDQVLFYLVIILVGVFWILFSTIWRFKSSSFVHKYYNHSTAIELIWTMSPALILVAIAFPSFKLLYLMDEVIDPAITVKAIGHQWFWSYEYSDFEDSIGHAIEFDSYMIPTEDLEIGQLRQLEVDNWVLLPVNTHVRFIVTSADVIHDLAVPALGLKVDANPGWLNQTSTLILWEGVYYGQCSELCGVLHSSMPIVIEAVSVDKFLDWLDCQ